MTDLSLQAPRSSQLQNRLDVPLAPKAIGKLQAKQDATFSSSCVGAITEDITVRAISSDNVVSVIYKPGKWTSSAPELDENDEQRIREIVQKALVNPIWRKANPALTKLWGDGKEKRRSAALLHHLNCLQSYAKGGDFFEAIYGILEILLSQERDVLAEHPALVSTPFSVVARKFSTSEGIGNISTAPIESEEKTILLALETIWLIFCTSPQSSISHLCLSLPGPETENLFKNFLSAPKHYFDESELQKLWALALVKATSTDELAGNLRAHDCIYVICDILCSQHTVKTSIILTYAFFALFRSNSSSPIIQAAMNSTASNPSMSLLPRLMGHTAVLPVVLLAQLVKTPAGRECLQENVSFLSSVWQRIPDVALLVFKPPKEKSLSKNSILYIQRCLGLGFAGLVFCGIHVSDEKPLDNKLPISGLHLALVDSLLAVDSADIQFTAFITLLLMLESKLTKSSCNDEDHSSFWKGLPSLAQQLFSKSMLFLDLRRFEKKVVALAQRVIFTFIQGFSHIKRAYAPQVKIMLHPEPQKLFLTALNNFSTANLRQIVVSYHTLLWLVTKENGYDVDDDDASQIISSIDKLLESIRPKIIDSSSSNQSIVLGMAIIWQLCRRGFSKICIERGMMANILQVAWLCSQQPCVAELPMAWCLGVVWAMLYESRGRREFAEHENCDGLVVAVLRYFRAGPALSIFLKMCLIFLHKNPREKQHQNITVAIIEPLLDVIKPVQNVENLSPAIRRMALKLLSSLVGRSRSHEEELVRLNTSMLEVYMAILRENPEPALLEHVCHRVATLATLPSNRQVLFNMGGTESLLRLWSMGGQAKRASETEESEVDLEHFVEKRNALRLLLNALLNVSVENSENQMLICKKGIHMLHRLLVDPTNSERDEEAYAEGILVNLKRCPSNRSILYNAQLDSAILHARLGDSESARMDRARDDNISRKKRQGAFRKIALKSMHQRWHTTGCTEKNEYLTAKYDSGKDNYSGVEEETLKQEKKPVNASYGSYLWSPLVSRSGAKLRKTPLGRLERAVHLSIPRSKSSFEIDASKFKFSLEVPEHATKSLEIPEVKDESGVFATLLNAEDKYRPKESAGQPVSSSSNMFASKLKQSSSERRLAELLREHELIYGASTTAHTTTKLRKAACWRAGMPNSFSEKLFGPRVKLDDGTEVYVYHQEVDGSGAIMPSPLNDDNILGSLPYPDSLDIGGIPQLLQISFFPLEMCPFSIEGSLSRFYFKNMIDEMEADLCASLDGMNFTSALHDTSNDDDHFTLQIELDINTQDEEGEDNDEEETKSNTDPPWDASCSIFHPRIREADARSMLDTATTYRKAFRSDWNKCLKKENRFLNIIKKGCTEPKAKAVVRTAEIMEKYYGKILQCFLTYCCMADATNCSWMTFGAFAAFVDDADIADEDSKSCRLADIDTIFKATDFDSTRGKSGNPGKSLTRSEFAESLIRMSQAKFGGKNVDAHMTIERFLKHVFSRVGEAANDFRAEWRPRILYTAPVDLIIRKYLPSLERIFYDRDERDFWNLDTWEDTLAEANMYEDSFTRQEGNLAFYFGKMVVVDTEKHADRYQGLDWLAFLEALAHMARFKEIPTREKLDALDCSDIIDYEMKIRAEGLTWTDLLDGGSSLSQAGSSVEKFAFHLDCCLHLFVFFLDKRFSKNDERSGFFK